MLLDEEIDKIATSEIGEMGRFLIRYTLKGSVPLGQEVDSFPLKIDRLIDEASEGERLTSQYKYVRDYDVG